MADNRELTFGMGFGLDDAIGQLNDAIDRLEEIVDTAQEAEDAAVGMGANIQAGTSAAAEGAREAADALGDLDDSTDDVGTGFRDMGREADSFGRAVSQSMGTALKSGSSTAKGLKAGFDGAIGFTEKKFTAFFKKTKAGAKDIGTAFKHPIQTIKAKLGEALLSAGKDADELGDKADDARKDLDDMGKAGGDAGGQIKDAIGGALKTFVGLEAIKAGIGLLKDLGKAALEAAGAAESSSKKFEASFAGTDAAAWVENYAASVHRSTAEIEGFMVSNKAMYGELGITGDAASELSKITTSLAYDIGNAFSMDDAEALGVIQDYIGGNSAALEEYGVHIDDATLKAAALEMGLGSQLDALDDAAMAQVRMNALLGQSSKIQQAAVKDTGGLVNSTKSLKGIFGEFMADAGAKFAPTIEGFFGIILENWPVIEPMLMQLVTVLSDGLAQAMPVIMELGQVLLPVLSDVLGTVFQAAVPLLSVFGDLAQTILPPLAGIVGMIAETVMPPLVNILETLNTAIIQPLVPVIQKLAEALLPPIAKLLEAVSPILEAISPVLSVIGDVLGVIADVLGSVVGWLADGVGAVANFFSGLFGGAKESESAVNDLSGAVDGLDEATSKETSLVVDTSDYKNKVEGAAEASSAAVKESANEAKEITDVNFIAMGASATAAYGTMQTDAETAWAAMTSAADNGTDRIISNFSRIAAAAKEASASSNIKIGADIPHNAKGTDNFEGGPTWMNEEGGELAILPGGSAIIPADQTDRLMQSFTNSTTNDNRSSSTSSSTTVTLAPNIQITVTGAVDDDSLSRMKAELKGVFDELYQEAQERDYKDRAVQAGLL